MKLSEKFDQLGSVIKELVNVGDSAGDTSVIKSSVANLEKMQSSIIRQIESNG